MFVLHCFRVTLLQYCSHLSLIFVSVPMKLLSIERNFTGHKLPADTGEMRTTQGVWECSISMTESFQGAHRYQSGTVTHFCLSWWKILKSIINNRCVNPIFFLAEMVAVQRSTWRLFLHCKVRLASRNKQAWGDRYRFWILKSSSF